MSKEPSMFRNYFENVSVLVTGGAGFIGSHLVEELVRYGARAIVIDNFCNGKIENLTNVRDKCKIIEGDIRDEQVVASVKGVDYIFNLAATPLLESFKDPKYDLSVNTAGLINMLELSRATHAKLVHASTGSVYGNPVVIPITEDHQLNPISPYGVSKLAAEHYSVLYADVYDVDVCCLRYFNVYGPRQVVTEEMGVVPIFISRLLAGKPIHIFGDGNQTRDFVHVSDVVNGTLLAAVSNKVKGGIFNIGGKRVEVSIRELAGLIAKLLGKNSEIMFKEPKPGDIRRLVADSSKAKSVFGYEPTVALEQGLLAYIDWFKQE